MSQLSNVLIIYNLFDNTIIRDQNKLLVCNQKFNNCVNSKADVWVISHCVLQQILDTNRMQNVNCELWIPKFYFLQKFTFCLLGWFKHNTVVFQPSKYQSDAMGLHEFFHHSAIVSCITLHIWKSADCYFSNKVYRDILRNSYVPTKTLKCLCTLYLTIYRFS